MNRLSAFLRSFRFASYAFALTVVLAGLVDAAGIAVGGSERDLLLVAGLTLIGLGAGLLRPGPCGSLHVAAALSLGALAWLLPVLPRWLATICVLGSLLPLAIVGRRFGQALAGGSPGGAALPVGVFFGLVLAGFGTGPWIYLLMVVGILWPPPAAAEERPDALPAPAVDRIALFLTAFAAGLVAIALRPLLTTLDSGNVLQDTRRIVSLFACFGIGWWALGAAIADAGRWRWLGGAGAMALAAVGLQRAAFTADRLNGTEAFQSLVANPRLLGWLGRAEHQPLTELDALYVPLLSFAIAAFPVIALVAGMRAAAGTPRQDDRWPVRFGMLLVGLGSGVLVTGAVAVNSLGAGLLTAGFFVLLVAAAALALGAGLRVGGPAAALAVVLPWALAGPPPHPEPGRPFYERHEYTLVRNQSGEAAQRMTPSSFVYVLDRQTPGLPGSYQLRDGRNLVGPLADDELAWQVDGVFPLLLAGPVRRALMVGAPHGATAAVWRELGVEEVHLAADPVELARLAWGFTPDWAGIAVDGISSTAARADGRFDYALVRDTALWETRRNRSLRPGALRDVAARLNPGGTAAIAFDPRRAVPGLVSAAREALAAALGAEVTVYLIPHQAFVPSIVLVGRKPGGDPQADTGRGLRTELWLADHGLRLNRDVDLPLLQVSTDGDRTELYAGLLDGPLPPLSLALIGTTRHRMEEGRPWRTAARVLAGLGPDGSLPWVLATHASAQLWGLKDTQVVPREEKLDFDAPALAGLADLAAQHPRSEALKELAENFAIGAVRARELEAAYPFLQQVVDELDWRTPWLLVAYGQLLNEMLMPEEAEAMANEALAMQPGFEPALSLRAVARGEEDPFRESRESHEGHDH